MFIRFCTKIIYRDVWQAEHVLKESVVTMRNENSRLTVEIVELKNDIGILEDQVKYITLAAAK
jgi:hypothetical protein